MLALLVVAFAVVAGMLMTPSGKLVSLRSEALGVDQAWAFAFNNVGWSAGVGLGAAARRRAGAGRRRLAAVRPLRGAAARDRRWSRAAAAA